VCFLTLNVTWDLVELRPLGKALTVLVEAKTKLPDEVEVTDENEEV